MDEDDLPILCSNAYDLPALDTGEVMVMPGGLQTITPIDGGLKDRAIKVMVDRAGAEALEAQRVALTARGKRPYFDFNHDDGEASHWPEEFFWRELPTPGIYARGEWTGEGRTKVSGKSFRQFSPVFHVDNKRGNPARIICNLGAKPNMGGLVNDPAFHNILPLWAKSGDAGKPTNQPDMNEQELAALRNKIEGLKTEVDALKAKDTALKAKNETDAVVSAELRAKEAEIRAAEAELEAESLRATNKSQGAAIHARNKADADAAVQRAVERGAIAAKDTDTQTALAAKAADDPGFIAAIEALPGSQLNGRITPSGVRISKEAPNTVLKSYAAVVAQNAALSMDGINAREKSKLAREAGAIYAKEIASDDSYQDMTMDEAIRAADVSSDQLGLLSGTLVLQRTLPLLQYQYPILSTVTQDFSDMPGLLNQTEMTRIVLKPAVQEYDPSVDTSGRPKGWETVSPAQTVNVPVTLDKHVGVPIVFGVQTLASTIRNLFGETSSQALNALGGHLAQRLAALMTAANFNAYAGTSVGGGVTTTGSTEVTVTATTNMYPGQEISGTGIPAGTYVASITSSTKARLTQAATADGTALTFTLNGGKVPQTYATYAKAKADFGNGSLGEIAAALDTMEVPEEDRFMMLNAQYYGKLASEPLSNTYFTAMRNPEILTDRRLPKLQGFDPIKAPWLPSSGNRTGFAAHKSALVLKTRLPSDFTSAVGAMVPGSVATVTAPGGFSVLLVQYISLKGNYAEWRPEVLTGVAVGERRAGLVLTSS